MPEKASVLSDYEYTIFRFEAKTLSGALLKTEYGWPFLLVYKNETVLAKRGRFLHALSILNYIKNSHHPKLFHITLLDLTLK